MSQSGISTITSGMLPPSVPTTFTADSGNAVPAGNNLNVLGGDTTTNNDNGIQTLGSGSTLTIQLSNRSTGTATTSDATPTTVLSLSLGSTPGVYFIEGNVVGFNTTDSAGGAYSFTSGMITDGATATEIGSEFKDVFEQAAMASADFNIIASGNSVIVQAVGIAAKTINWNVFLTYRFVS